MLDLGGGDPLVTCPECGRDTGARDARFCGRCGAQLTPIRSGTGRGADRRTAPTDAEPDLEAPAPAGRPAAVRVLLAGLALVVVGGSGFLAVARTTSEPDQVSPVDPAAAPNWTDPMRGECTSDHRGCELWRIPGDDPETVFVGPATFAEYGYAAFRSAGDSGVHAFDLTSGEGSWTVTVDGLVRGAPAAGRGLVVVAVEADGASEIRAYAATTGAELWRTGLSFVPEGPLEVLDEVVFVAGEGTAVGLSHDDGTRRLRFPIEGTVTGPVVERRGLQHLLYYGHAGGVEAVDLSGGDDGWSVDTGRSWVGSQISTIDVGIVVAVDEEGSIAGYAARTGERLWSRDDLDVPTVPPLVQQLRLLVLAGGRWVDLDPTTGRARRSPNLFEPQRRAPVPYRVEPPAAWLLASGTVYATYANRLTAHDSGGDGRPAWSVRFAPRDAWVAHRPAVARDTVVLATPEGIIAVKR